MQFAIINDVRTTPAPGLTGQCPSCGSEVIPKCGNIRIHHWSHRGMRSCDPWHEPETQWHRDWKNAFPVDWQEIQHRAEDGEKHIADVRTAHGVVFEFQRSHIDPDEQRAREHFYKNMVWVVDGSRLKRDAMRFQEASDLFHHTPLKSVYLVTNPEKCFPPNWLHCSTAVFFDFEGSKDPALRDTTRELLWRLLPGRALGHAVVGPMTRANLINSAHTKEKIIEQQQAIVEGMEAFLKFEAQRTAQSAHRPLLMPRTPWRGRRRRW